MGGTVQQLKISGISTQLEILSVWMHRRLLYSTLSVPKADDLHVGKITANWKAILLQHEIATVASAGGERSEESGKEQRGFLQS